MFVDAQIEKDCKEWKVSSPIQLHLPVFAEIGSVDGKVFDRLELLSNTKVSNTSAISLIKQDDSFDVPGIDSKNQLVELTGYVSVSQWLEAKIKIKSNSIYEVYLDGEKCKTVSKPNEEINIPVKLQTGKHQIIIKALSVDENLTMQASYVVEEELTQAIAWSVDAQRTMTIHDLLDGVSVQNLKISHSGNYALVQMSDVMKGTGKKQQITHIIDLNENKVVYKVRNFAYNLSWLPKSDRLSYLIKNDQGTSLFVYDIMSGKEACISENIDDMYLSQWSPNEDFVILSKTIKADKPGDLKRIFGNDDRLPYFRNRTNLYLLHTENGLIQPLTAGNLSANLNDIKPDGSKILFSTTEMDYQTTPFYRQDMYELSLKTFELDTLWKDELYGCYCKYSPDGQKLLAMGSAKAFGDLGLKITNGHLPNSFDNQLYIYNLAQKKATVLTKDFSPSINGAKWFDNNIIYTQVTERDGVNLYVCDVSKSSFTKIDLPVEVLDDFDFAYDKQIAIFNGTSISTPEKVYTINLKNKKYTELDFPKEQTYRYIAFGKSEKWTFENKSGLTIDGRVYYPVNYDPSKKYPLIVYYYGGTSPTDRSFGGRYPKNIWAANGYMVYVLQPSGATGYGQNFSALHVNGWGKDAIDDIIDGTKAFLKSHPTADAKNVGCIGASYGGFTTMMLQTRTDIFKTAIAHAGISDISSYWGEGYWGYSYSSAAATGSYPWNRKDIYVENSPLFNADKFQNSILLLHGTSDTNVPVGESLQYYAALKILGKDVEMVLIDGENHHILDYKKRIKWNDTIIAWFDKVLKDQSGQWSNMYPDKKL